MGDDSMLELKRIYWSRQMLKLAYAAVMVWLIISAFGASGRARRPLLSLVQRRLHQPAELRRRLRQVQPRQACQDPVAGPAPADGTTTAGVPAAVVPRRRGRTAAAARNWANDISWRWKRTSSPG
jgi:hypothetical protein